MKAFIEAQFSYCPLIWMFNDRNINRKINHLHERSLRIVYKDNKASFEELLRKDNSVTIHHRNIQSLAIELYKIKENLSNTIMNNLFQTRVLNYSFRTQNEFMRRPVNTTKFGLNSLQYFASKVWQSIPTDIKNSNNLEVFKNKIRKWKFENCDCNLCKDYISGVGYIN